MCLVLGVNSFYHLPIFVSWALFGKHTKEDPKYKLKYKEFNNQKPKETLKLQESNRKANKILKKHKTW